MTQNPTYICENIERGLPFESVHTTNKDTIVSYLKSKEPVMRAGGYVVDAITGSKTKIPLETYRDGDWCWDTTDIYNFEKYDAKLKDEFIDFIVFKM